MAYVVRLSVSLRRDHLLEGKVRSAVRRGGGTIDRVENRRATPGGQVITYVILLDQPQRMHGIVKNVEAVAGAAVISAGSPMVLSDEDAVRRPQP